MAICHLSTPAAFLPWSVIRGVSLFYVSNTRFASSAAEDMYQLLFQPFQNLSSRCAPHYTRACNRQSVGIAERHRAPAKRVLPSEMPPRAMTAAFWASPF
jgi:hypothetical protein